MISDKDILEAYFKTHHKTWEVMLDEAIVAATDIDALARINATLYHKIETIVARSKEVQKP